ncbi:MAG TPA: CsgG/HfaB family protein [Bryobacteraceae bacterium]|nr:CsgG/HfaB family protein [Bryobacteraceae bacterium]
MKFFSLVSIALLAATMVPAQTSAPKKTTAHTAPAAKSPVDNVIELVKSGMSENLIIKSLKRTNKPIDLSTADMVKLREAGVSDNIIGVMLDPTANPVPAGSASPQPTPISVAPASAPAPAAQPAPAPAPEPAPVASAPAPAPSGPPTQAEKKRVIVDEFDYSAVKSSVQAIFNTQQDIGKGIRAMLIKRLADANKLVVVERAKINQLMAEQDRNTSNRVKQGSGARVGQISGADAVLAGDIIIFGRDDKKTNIGGGGFSRLGGFGGLHIKKEEDKAVVAIDYRLIDAETSEVIATGEARGESSRKSSGIGGFGGAWGAGGGGGGVDMTSSNFGSTIIGEATQDCVNKLADILSQQTTTMKKTVRPVEARVADVSGSTLVITAGSNDGVNVGDVFEVLKVMREVRDPVTKEVLDTITQKSGEMTIVSVREKIATGNYAGSAAGVGFIARKKLPGGQQ